MDLKGKTALVTGGARRIGRAIALALAGRGARVVVHYLRSARDARATIAAARRLGVAAECVRADLRDPRQIRRMLSALPPVDVLINNASVYDADARVDVDRVLETNVRAPWELMRALAPSMKRRGAGKIVNLADWTGARPDPRFTIYSASKAALISLTQSFALAYAPEVQVNAVAPGAILPPERGGRAAVAGAVARTPLKRRGSPDDIANAVLYLIERGDYVTGQTLFVDGGRILNG